MKIVKVLSQHSQLFHLNLNETLLGREEVFFIALMAKHYKCLVGLHLPLQTLAKYDCVFLRMLLNAKEGPEAGVVNQKV